MFTKQDCPKCDWTEAYFDQFATEYSTHFVFAIMNVDKNYPTSDIREFVYGESDSMMQFLIVLPDGGTLNRFQKEGDTYEDLKKFLDNAQYLVHLYQKDVMPPKVEEETVEVAVNETVKEEF